MAGKKGQWEEADDLQAVVLADSFNTRFAPLTQQKPRALLPLCNTPLLDYTIEFLAAAGVKEIFIFCCSLAEVLQKHIDEGPWSKDKSVTLRAIVLQKCLSVGDAMREIDNLGIIRKEFVLVSGDIVSNYDLGALAEQRERSKKDKSAIMTMIMKQIHPRQAIRSREEQITVAIDNETKRLMSYTTKQDSSSLDVPMHVFSESTALVLRDDLIDCHIYLCSQEVLLQFADNFDYQNMQDFILGTLADDEVQDNKLYTHILQTEYAARVSNPESYDAISKDVIHRWTYPVVPDIFSPAGTCARYKRNHVYLGKGVILARSCSIQEDSLIGENTRIGVENGSVTTISESVIGKNCVIGAGVRLDNVYVFDNVVIEDNCTITHAILGDGVAVKSNVNIGGGSLLGYDVIVGPEISIPPHSKVSLTCQPEDDFFDDDVPGVLPDSQSNDEVTANDIGAEGKGYIWTTCSSESDHLCSWGFAGSQAESSDDEDSDEFSDEEFNQEEYTGEFDGNEEAPATDQVQDDWETFYEEVLDVMRARVYTCKDNFDNVVVDNVALEVSGSRSAHHMTPRDTARALLRAVIASSDALTDSKEVVSYLKSAITKTATVFLNYIKTSDDQLDAIEAIESSCVDFEHATPCFQSILHVLYEEDVLDEAILTKWHAKCNPTDEVRIKLHQQAKPLITWLNEAEEESSEEESSDSD